MKFNIKNRIMASAALLMVMIGADSCKKGVFYDGINTNPSQLANPTPTLLLPGVISSTGYVWGGDASRFSSLFMQQTTGVANQAIAFSAYSVGVGDVDTYWTNLYGAAGGVMTNAYQMITLSTQTNQLHYEGIAKVLMANALGLATDDWGDVPYSQAFLGRANLNPSYDTQQSIYASLDKLLSDAITELNATDNTTPQPGVDDLIYGGNLSGWVGAAYALKAKFYLHLGKVDPTNYAKALAAAQSAIAAGFSTATNFVVPFTGTSTTSQNPWYQFNTQRGDIAFTGYMFNIMQAANDPRLSVYSDGGGGLGTLYGNANSPVDLLTYDELLFIESEAYFQSGDKTNAAATYNAAVTANLARTVGTTTYALTVAQTPATITLNSIITQKYIADFLDPECWTDYRRTGFPALTPNSSGNGAIPRSLLYPISEVINNTSTPKNTSLARKVYWDK